MMGAGGARKVTGEELEMELSEPSTPVLLDVYAQVRTDGRTGVRWVGWGRVID